MVALCPRRDHASDSLPHASVASSDEAALDVIDRKLAPADWAPRFRQTGKSGHCVLASRADWVMANWPEFAYCGPIPITL
jgi:hypothetical protein